jgi:hypothetical protein
MCSNWKRSGTDWACKGAVMTQPEELELAIADAERCMAEQNAELEVAFAKLQSLGSSRLDVEEHELAALASCETGSIAPARPIVMGTRC